MFGKPLSALLLLPIAALLSVSASPLPQVAQPSAEMAARFTTAAMVDACGDNDGWTDPAPPAHIYGNTWYVGTCGITALLVTTPQGHILIDAGMPDAAPLVAANIEKLGLSLKDVRWIVGSHEHFDHAGGIPELKRRSGARLAATPVWAKVMASGKPAAEDPQYLSLLERPIPAVKTDRVLRGGAVLAFGGAVLKPTMTPAHSPGSTSWTWQTCEGGQCRTITYADSASTISSGLYNFSVRPKRVKEVRSGLQSIGKLDCGILITPHPSASALFERMKAGLTPDEAACPAYAQAAEERFAKRLSEDQETMQAALDALEAAKKAAKQLAKESAPK